MYFSKKHLPEKMFSKIILHQASPIKHDLLPPYLDQKFYSKIEALLHSYYGIEQLDSMYRLEAYRTTEIELASVFVQSVFAPRVHLLDYPAYMEELAHKRYCLFLP